MHLSAPLGLRPPATAGALPLILAAAPFEALRDSPHRHAVIACDCAASTVPPGFDRASLRTMRRGAELLKLGVRRLRLDQDAYVVLNPGRDRASAYAGDALIGPLSIVFRRGALAQGRTPPDALPGEADGADFLEALRPHGDAVTQHLRQIERALRERVDDAVWWDERIALLLAAAIDAEAALRRREGAMPAIKPATRRELLRRVLIASDYIQSHYDRPISLHDIATAAHLSEFHLVRLFQRAHGITPHAYLTRKRLDVARRLLTQTPLGLCEVAARAGLGTRSSLFRHLRREQGFGAAALRARAGLSMEYPPCITSA